MPAARDTDSPCVGWDIGGAHLKYALLDTHGRLLRAAQYATPLWQGLDRLERVLAGLAAELPPARHALTMTGELVDIFPSRRDGVLHLLQMFAARFPGNLAVYAGRRGFVAPAAAPDQWPHIASANWHATASVAAAAVQSGMLMDTGSTTTDLVPMEQGRVSAAGHSDFERLRCGEMVYTGVLRTPVMAVVQRVPFRGRWQNVAADFFATMADVYRVTGELDADSDLLETADGGDRGWSGSVRRLARMLGSDPEPAWPEGDWRRLAAFIGERQLLLVQRSFRRVLAHRPQWQCMHVIGTGAGRFLARRLAQRQGCNYSDLESLAGMPAAIRGPGANCGTAIAVALLARAAGIP